MQDRMWYGFLALVLSAGSVWPAAARGEDPAKPAFPQLVLDNGSLKLTVYLPDAEKGYYRALRFEPSGLVGKAEFAGHSVFGPFRTPHDPLGHDSILGPAEEFDMDTPPGYSEAKAGETFVKIGVGVLLKEKDAPYAFAGRYKVVKRGTWDVTSGEDWVEFRQDLTDDHGYAYTYTKRLSLAGTSFVLAHTLKNTGSKSIDTTVYCHNFIIIDGEPIGAAYRIAFPFDLAEVREGKADFNGKELVMPARVGTLWAKLAGYQYQAEDNQVTVQNTKSGAGVKIVGDQPPDEWRFYAEKTGACPEAFVRIQVASGQEKTWQSTYTFFVAASPLTVSASPIERAATALGQYRGELQAVRKAFGGVRDMPDVPFFLLGMGLRPKLIYRDGVLSTWPGGESLRRWAVKQCLIVPPDYSVYLTTNSDKAVGISEGEEGISIEENGKETWVEGSRVPVKLPPFSEFRYPGILRVLHQEILVNITPAGPVPNFLVYSKPWYRDAAMMAMCLKETGNLDSIRAWVLGLNGVFDRNNAGETEADNLGQVLFLISLVSDKNHPLVPKILAEANRFVVQTNGIKYIKGRSDFADRPVYQTKWLKYGLHALGLPDEYTIPELPDGYSALFWMDYRQAHVTSEDAYDTNKYPYLGWACDHFYGQHRGGISNRDYPLSWEQEASQAHYEGMHPLGDVFVKRRISVPHTWHAAEMFLYLRELKQERTSPARAG